MNTNTTAPDASQIANALEVIEAAIKALPEFDRDDAALRWFESERRNALGIKQLMEGRRPTPASIDTSEYLAHWFLSAISTVLGDAQVEDEAAADDDD